MSTPYEIIFDSFTSKISDDLFTTLSVPEAEDQMIQLLNDSLIFFKYPKVNVFNKNDTTKVFIEDLTYFEIQIISQLMVYAWIERQIKNIKLIKQKFTDRDFKMTSQSAHLESLLKLSTNQLTVCNKLMKDYYKTSSSLPVYSNLAGEKE